MFSTTQPTLLPRLFVVDSMIFNGMSWFYISILVVVFHHFVIVLVAPPEILSPVSNTEYDLLRMVITFTYEYMKRGKPHLEQR